MAADLTSEDGTTKSATVLIGPTVGSSWSRLKIQLSEIEGTRRGVHPAEAADPPAPEGPGRPPEARGRLASDGRRRPGRVLRRRRLRADPPRGRPGRDRRGARGDGRRRRREARGAPAGAGVPRRDRP